MGRSLQDAEQSVLGPLQNHDPSGITKLVPAGAAFRYYSVTGSTPERTRQSYRLVVGGLVLRPATFTLDDLERMPHTAPTRDFQCVTGWRVSDVAWSGVALPDLLDVVGVSRRARALRLSSFDGTYTESLTLEGLSLNPPATARGRNGHRPAASASDKKSSGTRPDHHQQPGLAS